MATADFAMAYVARKTWKEMLEGSDAELAGRRREEDQEAAGEEKIKPCRRAFFFLGSTGKKRPQQQQKKVHPGGARLDSSTIEATKAGGR